jgi:hypothetical protein
VVVRQLGRINAVLVAVREFLKHAVAVGDAPGRVLSALYEIGDDRWFLRICAASVLACVSWRGRTTACQFQSVTQLDPPMTTRWRCCAHAGRHATGCSA